MHTEFQRNFSDCHRENFIDWIVLAVMNIHTFKDAATAKRNALVNDLDVDDEDQDVAELKSGVVGEEEDGQLQVQTNISYLLSYFRQTFNKFFYFLVQ